jgi:Conserved in the green lineage and diatoms 27
MSISKKICPVPFDQQPSNEYNHLKNSVTFSDFNINLIDSFKNLILLFILINLLLFIPGSYVLIKSSLLIWEATVASFALMLAIILVRLYLGWSYVLKRLLSATVFYEESGWYDGQIWIKSADMLIQDRLIGIYDVRPILTRIKKLLIFISFSLCLQSMLLIVTFVSRY